jgi:hypothetical protein
MNTPFQQWIAIQANAHQQLLEDCELILCGKLIIINCCDREAALAVSAAMPLLVDGLQVLGVNNIQICSPEGIEEQLTVGAAKMMQRRAFARITQSLDAICQCL